MKLKLTEYRGMNICVALSGGRDSMALLHRLLAEAEVYGICVTALNCEHGLRGEQSKRDSEFVKNYCKTHNVPLKSYAADCNAIAEMRGESVETAARNWRLECYLDAADYFGAAIATAHHISDNAETILFNLARGSGLSGVTGIADGEIKQGSRSCRVIRPLISCTRAEIEEYIEQNGIPFVEDSTNLSDAYTRNYIRHKVIPELEKAVPGAAENIYRFSRLVAEDDEYLTRKATGEYLYFTHGTAFISHCEERPLFSRAALAAVVGQFGKKDYTALHIESLYSLQFLEIGKTFEFLGLIAYSEEGRIAITVKRGNIEKVLPFKPCENLQDFGFPLTIGELGDGLYFDFDKVPGGAVIRTRRAGDKFTKFGGGTKSLGDFLTDRKVPKRVRDLLPVIAVGNEILAVCGVEISEKIKVDESTQNRFSIVCKWQ